MDFLEIARKNTQNTEPLNLSLDLFSSLKTDKFVMMQVQDFHIEAIRRRCDHDCDGVLNIHEFREIIFGVQTPVSLFPPKEESPKKKKKNKSINYYEDEEETIEEGNVEGTDTGAALAEDSVI